MYKFWKKNNIYIILFIVSFFASLVGSGYSPFSSLSYLNYDSTVFYIIGRGMKYGYVPYIDLIDHKGIYIFLVNYIGSLITEQNHIGIFIVNYVFTFASMIFAYKIADLLTNNKIVSALSSISFFFIQLTYYFCYCGMKCESMLFPFILYANYKHLEYLHGNNKQVQYNLLFIFKMGIFIGITIFTKANLVICYLPIIISIFIETIQQRKIVNLLKCFLVGILGIAVGCLPAIIVAFKLNCFKEMIHYTFELNYLYAKEIYYQYSSYINAIINIIYDFAVIIILSLISIFAFVRYKLTLKTNINYILTVVFNFIASFVALRSRTYYTLPLLMNIYILVIFFYETIYKTFSNKKILFNTLLVVIFIINCFLFCRFSLVTNIKSGYRENVLCNRIKDIYVPNKSLLVIGAGLQVYNTLNIFPNEKNFCLPDIDMSFYSKPFDEVLNNIENENSDIVVASFMPLMIRSGFAEKVRKLLDEKYDFIEDVRGIPASIYFKK